MARRKKDQKKADETLVDIVEVRDSAQDFLDHNQRYIFGGLTLIVLIIGGYLAYNNFYKKPRQASAMEQMYQAQVQFERDSFALALTNPGGGYEGFLDIVDNYKGTAAANTAKYYAGICYLYLGKYEAAVDYLRDFNAKGDVTPIMKYGALGDAYSELGEFDKALDYYERAVRQKDTGILTAYYLKKLGLLHERNGSFEEAAEAYRQIKEEFPNTPDGRDIEKYITRAEAQG